MAEVAATADEHVGPLAEMGLQQPIKGRDPDVLLHVAYPRRIGQRLQVSIRAGRGGAEGGSGCHRSSRAGQPVARYTA